jgi:predicted metal-binding protein
MSERTTRQVIEAELEKMAKDSGATAFVPMSTSQVVTAHWVRLRCQYGCKYYGTRFTCPPYSPDPEVTRKVLDEYEVAYLIRYEGFLGLDTYPPNSLYDSLKKMSVRACDAGFEMERHAFLAGYYKAYLYGAHRCYRCETCGVEEGKSKCRFPVKARPSLESAGIDVFATAKNAGIETHVIRDKSVMCPEDLPTFMLLLLE